MGTAMFVFDSKAAVAIAKKTDSRRQSKGCMKGNPSSEGETCNHCQKPGHITPNCPGRQWFMRRGWGHGAASCPENMQIPKGNNEKQENPLSSRF